MKALFHTLSIRGSVGVIAFGACLFSSYLSHGQGFYNESSVFIDGVNIYVDGEFTNTGRLINDGTIVFSGNWESAGRYSGNGSIEANGNKPQKISHHNQNVNSLIIDGWGTKYIKGALHITGSLYLNEGIVEVSADDALKLKKDVWISGGSSASYVDGALTVEGNGYKFFPIGKNGSYAPIEFLNVRGEPAEYSMEVFEDAPLVSIDNIIVRSALYWQRRDFMGHFGGSAIAIDFDDAYFEKPEKMVMLAGRSWEEPFLTVTDLERSAETEKILTHSNLSAPLILLGEMSEQWREADFYFSTALSPNASYSENRTVKIFGERLAGTEFHFQVFNRWGSLVYESRSLDHMTANGWDGRSSNGGELMSGTYPYKLRALDKTGKKFEKNGVITIIH